MSLNSSEISHIIFKDNELFPIMKMTTLLFGETAIKLL